MIRRRAITALMLFVGSVIASGGAYAQTVLYVDPDATTAPNDGSTWCNGFLDLQGALAVATANTTIRVADGVYTPTVPNGDRGDRFQLKSGVELIGGHAGCGAPDPDLRDLVLFQSILSGDLNGDDQTGGDNSENSYHVVTGGAIDATAILDGFIIEGGHANGSNPSDRGAGVFFYPSISSATIRSCIIRDNVATEKAGGMYAYNYSGTMTGCVFSGNTSWRGGGALVWNANPEFVGCLFIGNEATDAGGGVYNQSNTATYRQCRFQGNTGVNGGGMFAYQGTPSIIGSIFVGNDATGGGGMSNQLSSPVIESTVFRDNTSTSSGGGMLNYASSPRVASTVFNGNTATVHGGGVHSLFAGSPSFENCTFAHNSAFLGGGVGNASAQTTVTSCVLWGNSGSGESAQIGVSSGVVTLDYSCVEGLSGQFGGTGNVGTDPLFVDALGVDGAAGTDDDDLSLADTSPSANRGDPTFVPDPGETDAAGEARVQSCRVDMGAYETSAIQLPGDFDADGGIDLADFSAMQACFGTATAGPGWEATCVCVFDSVQDGVLDLEDFATFLTTLDGP